MEDVRYAQSGDASIAFHVAGDGPGTVFLGNFGTNMEAFEITLELRLWLDRLAESTRFVVYDQRGTGLSDRGTVALGLDVWVEDLEAVLDAAGLSEATLVAQDLAGPIAIALAGRRPARVSGLVLIGTFARMFNGDGYSSGIHAELRDAFHQIGVDGWGVPESEFNRAIVPGRDHAAWREQCARVQRLSSSPHGLSTLLSTLFSFDVRDELPQVRAPTLVLHGRADRLIPVSAGRFLVEQIHGARIVEFDTNQHFVFFEPGDESVDEILAFMGLGSTSRVGSHELVAVWYSDIVGSTEQLRASGDQAWHKRLEEHDRLVDHFLQGYGGELIKRLGDGVFALFGSTQDAVRCATRFSSACARMGLSVRIGVHVGDVERRLDGDVMGLSVHTAQRVEAEAAPGQVLVTETVRGAIAGAGFDLDPIGPRDLKGVGIAELYAVRKA